MDNAKRSQYPLFVGLLFTCADALLQLLATGLESATSLILEVEYTWNTIDSGYAVSLCICSFVPLYVLAQYLQKHRVLCQSTLLQLSLLVGWLMTWLLLPW